MIGATALHFHPDCLVVADEDAAGNLAEREYYECHGRGQPGAMTARCNDVSPAPLRCGRDSDHVTRGHA